MIKMQNCKTLVETIRRASGKEIDIEGWADARAWTEVSRALCSRTLKEFLNDSSQSSSVESPFDNHDLILLDTNLTHLGCSRGPRLTAESIAGYIRAFTAGTGTSSPSTRIPDVDFDLRFLIGDYTTRTDLALNETHLGNRALWTGNPRVTPLTTSSLGIGPT